MAQQHDGAAQQAEPIDITPAPGQAPEPLDAGLWGHDEDEPPADAAAGALAGAGALAAPAGRKRSTRTRLIVLGVVLLVALAVLATVGTTGVRILSQKDTTLNPPDSVAGLTRDSSANAAETSEYLRTALAAGIDLDTSFAAVYGDPTDLDRTVFFFGGTALLFSPERELDEVLTLLSDQRSDTSATREVPAGELDGVMKCGTITMPEGTMSACGWADHGSVGLAMFPEREVPAAAELMRQLREATQTRP